MINNDYNLKIQSKTQITTNIGGVHVEVSVDTETKKIEQVLLQPSFQKKHVVITDLDFFMEKMNEIIEAAKNIGN